MGWDGEDVLVEACLEVECTGAEACTPADGGNVDFTGNDLQAGI